MSTPEPQPEPQVDLGDDEKGTREYVILTEWKESGRVKARSDREALEKFMSDSGTDEGTFAAVTASRWKPRTVKTQTKTARVFE